MRRLIFWEFARASWQYDIVVALILAFILLTPRQIFRDQPRAANVVQIPSDKPQSVFWIEADLLISEPPERRPAKAVELVQKRTGKHLRLIRLEPIAAPDDEVKGFMAELRP